MTTINELREVDPNVLSIESRLFAEKAARSVAEIQSGLSDVSEVELFLEILGYDEEAAKNNGFTGVAALSNYISNFIDFYEDKTAKISSSKAFPKIHKVPIE